MWYKWEIMKNLLVENRWYFRLLKMCVCYFNPYRVFYPYFIRKSAWEIFAATNRKNTPKKRKYLHRPTQVLSMGDEDTCVGTWKYFHFLGQFSLKKCKGDAELFFIYGSPKTHDGILSQKNEFTSRWKHLRAMREPCSRYPPWFPVLLVPYR